MKTKIKLSSVGVVFAAILASACCWLPLALVALGASSLGFSAFFETARPYFLAATSLLLLVAIVVKTRANSKQEKCCDSKSEKFNIIKRVPWALVLVAASAIYLPSLLLAGHASKASDIGEQSWQLTLPPGTDLDSLERNLKAKVPGLLVQRIPEQEHELLLSMDTAKGSGVEGTLIHALDGVLGKGTAASALQGLQWQSFGVEGMTCDACVLHVENALSETPGVFRAKVDFGSKSAKILALPSFRDTEATRSVEKAGYHLKALASDGLEDSANYQNDDLVGGCCSSVE